MSAGWLDDLTPTEVLAWFPGRAEAMLDPPLTYDRAPALRAPDGVDAVFTQHDAARRSFVQVVVSLRHAPRSTPPVDVECSCKSWEPCLHAAVLLLDLSLSAPVRDAVQTGRPSGAYLGGLAALRLDARRAWTAEQIAARWLPVAPVTPMEPPEFHLVLPTDVDGAMPLQSRSLGFDGSPQLEVRLRLPGQRAQLDPANVPAAALPPEDRPLLRLLDRMGSGRRAFRATGGDASVALHLLRERAASRVRLEGTRDSIAFSSTTVTPHLVPTTLPRARVTSGPQVGVAVKSLYGAEGGGRWREPEVDPDDTVSALEGRWRSEDGTVDVAAWEALLFRGPFPCVWVPQRRAFFPVSSAVDLDVAWHLQVTPAIELVPGHAERIYRGLRRRLRGRAIALPSPGALGLTLDAPHFILRVEGRPLHVVARLQAQYAFGLVDVAPDTARAAEADDRRDPDLEATLGARVRDAGLTWNQFERAYTALDDAAAWFWTRGVPMLQRTPEEPELMVPASLPMRTVVHAHAVVAREGAHFDASVHFHAHDEPVAVTRLREALAQKRRWIELDDRTLAEIHDTVADLLDDLDDATPKGDGVAMILPLTDLGRVAEWADQHGAALGAEVRAMRRVLQQWPVAEPVVPAGLVATLRPYQRQGLAWLQMLRAFGVGGVLADDMGLGKTVMTLGLLAEWKERDGAAPSLVVCPTSVASNWVAEARRFTPTLRVLDLHRADPRVRAAVEPDDADLVVTTYAQLRRDAARWKGRRLRCLVLDEAQHIKNADAATARAARELDAVMRLALTGTPVENRLGELWSIADFCNPGSLGPRKHFEKRFEKPIAIGETPESDDTARATGRRRALQLRARIAPFVLRRRKREVLDDLPPRQEIDLQCALSPGHRQLYEALRAILRSELRASKERGDDSRMQVFTALLRLRQMACDPRLVDPRSEEVSAKREVLMERVRELVAEGRRALVFSQFVELLTLWRDDLDRAGVAYAYLDGSTRDRDAAVRRFTEGDVPLFLISLKAGGTGLNLTAADTVIHCDPWWNPAVEDQATDRAHRIGQTRAVTVYRLVARDTIESRILDMKDQKRALADAVLGGAALDALDPDTLEALLDDPT